MFPCVFIASGICKGSNKKLERKQYETKCPVGLGKKTLTQNYQEHGTQKPRVADNKQTMQGRGRTGEGESMHRAKVRSLPRCTTMRACASMACLAEQPSRESDWACSVFRHSAYFLITCFTEPAQVIRVAEAGCHVTDT